MAKKPKRRSKKPAKKKVIVPVIIILFILIVSGIFFVRETTIACGSTSVLSIDTVSLIDGGSKIRVLARAGTGSGECLAISWNKDDIEKKLEQSEGGDWEVTNSVSGSFTKISQSEQFPVFKDTSKIYSIAQMVKTTNTALGTCIGVCPSGTIGGHAFRKGGLFGAECYCIQTYSIGQDARFGETRDRDFEIEFSVDGLDPITLTQDTTTGRNDKVFVRWEGDLLRNQWLSTPNYDAMFFVNTQNWQFVDDGAYGDYKPVRENFIGDECSDPNDDWCYFAIWDYDKALAKVQRYNSETSNIIQNKKAEFLSQNPIIRRINVDTGNLLEVELETPMTTGLFTIEIDADWVGIRQVTGEPDLDCSNLGGFTVESGDTETQSFVITNIGTSQTERASFNLGVDCGTGASSQLSTYGVDLLGGESRTVKATVSAISTSGTKSFSCTITARDIISDEKDTCSYSFKAEEVTEDCTKNVCVGSDLWDCVNGIYLIKECQYGCDARNTRCYESTDEICDDGVDNDADGKIDMEDPDCQTKKGFLEMLKENILIVSIILSVLTSLGVFGYLYNTYEAKKKKKDNVNIVMFVIGSLSAGGLVYFLFKTFIDFIFTWQGILIIIAVGVVLFAIKNLMSKLNFLGLK